MTKMVKNIFASFGILLLVSLVACSGEFGSFASTQEPEVSISAELTQPVSQPELAALESGSAGLEPKPNAQPNGGLLPVPTDPNHEQLGVDEKEKPCNLAAAGIPFDISYPDNSILSTGEQAIKTWRLVNAGSCDWTADYSLVWFSGDNLSPTLEEPLNRLVKAGEMVDISVEIRLPETPGTYQSNWKLRSPKGELFGLGPNGSSAFWVRVQAVSEATPTSASDLTATPAPEVYASGLVELKLNSPVDLDQSGSGPIGTADLVLQPYENSLNQWALTAQNGAHLTFFGSATPTITECQTIGLAESSFLMRESDSGGTLCYRTDLGLPGYLRIKSIDTARQSITLEYLTWLVP